MNLSFLQYKIKRHDIMIKKLSIIGCIAILPFLLAYSPIKKEGRTPNIVFIEVDDLNYEYLSSFGSEIVNVVGLFSCSAGPNGVLGAHSSGNPGAA